MSLMLDDEVVLGTDSRYKSFTVAIEKVLKQFEQSSTEWSDLIPILAKMKKTLEIDGQFRSIPNRITLAKRLAQCLHPALPVGVHLRTLEVYDTIFRLIDKRSLQRDIILYSCGLFPLLPIAALSVKPVLLTLYETYFLPLGESLNSVLTGFLIGLFSALEEGADYYNRIILLLDSLANRIDEFYFYTCIWSAIYLVGSVRYSAVTFIINRFDKRKTMTDQMYLIGLSIETMVSAVCVCLYDNEQALVQRSILDFLLICLPMHKQQLAKENMIQIITMILHVLLKRDMGLNRRIYTWFLGTNDLCNSTDHELNDSSSYFITYTQEILIESLRSSLQTISTRPTLNTAISSASEDDDKSMTDTSNRSSSPWTLTKLIRVLLVLVDKPDVGPNIIGFIFMNYLLLVYEQAYQPAKAFISTNIQQENQYSETLKTFNVLLDTLEPYFIWELLTKSFDIILHQQGDNPSITGGSTIEQMCGIIGMLLDISPYESSTDTQSEHLSETLFGIIKTINHHLERLTPKQITLCIDMLLKLLKTLTPTDTKQHLSIFRSSIDNPQEIYDNQFSDSSTEDDNDYSTDIYNKLSRTDSIGKLQDPSILTEQDDLNDIERLLRQMVRKIEQQVHKLNNPLSDKKRSRLSTKTILDSMHHIDNSIELYKEFFHHFILTYFIDTNQISTKDKFQSIYSILQNRNNDSLSILFDRYQNVDAFQWKFNDHVNQYQTAFEDCCKLLVEFYCFPRQSVDSEQPILSKGQTDLDDWFIDLCLLSLCRSDHFSLQTTAMSVLIELFGYTLSSYTSTVKASTNHLIIPFLSQEQLSLFLNELDYFPYIIANLWECLSDRYDRESNSKASHILSILHSMLPNNLCEDLIYNQLSLTNLDPSTNEIQTLEGYKRFFKLWTSTRYLFNKTNEYLTKSFQRCLISVLSILRESNNYCLKSMIQQWIYDCFVQGDMSRIFDVLLLMLLHSDTARINMQRFDPITHKAFFLDQEQNSNSSNSTNEITFSLTFDNEDYDEEYRRDDEIESEKTDEDKRSRAISCMNPGETIYHIRTPPQTTKFPSLLSFSPPILSNFRSFSSPILLRSTKPRAPTISPVLSRNNIQQMYTSTTLVDDSFRAHSVPIESMMIKTKKSTDCQYVYILLYTQPYDYKRVALTLNIIESLIDFIPEQLIHSLLTTSNIQSSSMSIHNQQMHVFFLKHRRFIERKEFDLSTENTQEYQSYLYLLLHILLIYTYSYYPKYFDIQENHKIHIQSFALLTRVCHNLSCICMDNTILITYVINLLKKVSLQKIIVCLFNRLISQTSDFFQIKIISDYTHGDLPEQLIRQYLKELIQLLEEIILLEHIISSEDSNLIVQSIVNQNIFLSTILQYLRQTHSMENHRYMISLVVRILPHCGSALKVISTRIVEQICRNVCFVVQDHHQEDGAIKFKHSPSFDALDYVTHLIQRLAYICTYCLGTTSNNTHHFTPTLCPQHWMKKLSTNTSTLSDARQSILNKLPLVLSSLLFIWKTISIDQTNSIGLGNQIRQLRETIVEFVSSLIKSNGVSLIRAIAQCWSEQKQQQSKSGKDNSGEIQALMNILSNINHLTINDMIYHINELIRNQSTINDKKKQNYILWCLQFLLAYLEQQKNVSIDYWAMLAVMFKECLAQSTSSTITFLIIKILSFYVQQLPSFVDKRDIKDLQDITMKVLENCNTIVASSLKQKTWLWRNSRPRPVQSDAETPIQTIIESSNETDNDNSTLPADGQSTSHEIFSKETSHASLLALTILSEHAAKLLDVIYNLTDDKDRIVIPYLQNLVTNIMPYVRNHVLSNASSYRSASILLMTISQYSYTRKAWKKEVFEHLFDIGFFQVDLSILRSWKVIIDNMITNGKSTSFRDVLNRINTVQTGLFVSKEYEQRAMLIKRFAFVMYASEKDQYIQYLPEILACMTDLLKLPQIPILHTQMFFFLRVLLIRISSKNLISFWPIIMSELVQVLLQIEQDLQADVEGDVKSHVQPMVTTDLSSLTTSNSNHSLKLYLYACKLLDILLALPYAELYQFQLFRSAFVDDQSTINQNTTSATFVNFSIRLARLFKQKCPSIPLIQPSHCPLLRLRTLSSINELFPFFNSLSKLHLFDKSSFQNEQIRLSDQGNAIEISVLEDFVESWI